MSMTKVSGTTIRPTKKTRRWNHAYTFAFELVSNEEDGSDVTGAQLRTACMERLARLSDDEMTQACEMPYDTYECEPPVLNLDGLEKISERCWHAEQSWFYKLIVVFGKKKLNISIRRNAFDDQSYAKVYIWHGDTWNLVFDKHISECVCREVSYVEADVKPERFHEDAANLLDLAKKIVSY